jgi:hypothetical protein
MRTRTLLPALVLLASSLTARADSVFNFESTPTFTPLPLTLTSSGITATFTGSGAVCNVDGLFSTLSGNAIIQNLCLAGSGGPIGISFSQDLSSLSFDYATAGGPNTLTVDLFDAGALVGTDSFNSTDPAGYNNGEGLATLSGDFDQISLSTDGAVLALDNVDATPITTPTPEPNSLLLLGTAFGAGTLLLGRMAMPRKRYR